MGGTAGGRKVGGSGLTRFRSRMIERGSEVRKAPVRAMRADVGSGRGVSASIRKDVAEALGESHRGGRPGAG
jgi:molybdenum-dependent DNA-binding transcriptional regulator ModE